MLWKKNTIFVGLIKCYALISIRTEAKNAIPIAGQRLLSVNMPKVTFLLIHSRCGTRSVLVRGVLGESKQLIQIQIFIFHLRQLQIIIQRKINTKWLNKIRYDRDVDAIKNAKCKTNGTHAASYIISPPPQKKKPKNDDTCLLYSFCHFLQCLEAWRIILLVPVTNLIIRIFMENCIL